MHLRLDLRHPSRQVLDTHAAVSGLRCVQEEGNAMGCRGWRQLTDRNAHGYPVAVYQGRLPWLSCPYSLHRCLSMIGARRWHWQT